MRRSLLYTAPMAHPLVEQLRFARKEFQRGLKNISEEDGQKRLGTMNSLSWIVAHMAWQEQLYWLTRAQGLMPAPEVREQASGAPASTPSLAAAWKAWKAVTNASETWLDTLTSQRLTEFLTQDDGTPYRDSIGSFLLRTRHHYWYHLGESQAIRQLLGHTGLATYVGDQHGKAPYQPED